MTRWGLIIYKHYNYKSLHSRLHWAGSFLSSIIHLHLIPEPPLAVRGLNPRKTDGMRDKSSAVNISPGRVMSPSVTLSTSPPASQPSPAQDCTTKYQARFVRF